MDILSHPIVIEFVKLYDIIWNFKCLIEKIIPNNLNNKVKQILDKLKQMNMIRFDKTEKVTPQIVKMTLGADTILSQIKLLFNQVVDDLVLCKCDVSTKDDQSLCLSRSTDFNELKDKFQNLEIKYQIDKDYYINEIK